MSLSLSPSLSPFPPDHTHIHTWSWTLRSWRGKKMLSSSNTLSCPKWFIKSGNLRMAKSGKLMRGNSPFSPVYVAYQWVMAHWAVVTECLYAAIAFWVLWMALMNSSNESWHIWRYRGTFMCGNSALIRILCMYIYVYTHACDVCACHVYHIYIFVCIYKYIYICIYIHMYIYIHIYICIHICICIPCICIYVYTFVIQTRRR